MWILPKQLHISPYVPDMKALGLDCEEFGRMSEKSLMWRSKPSQSRTWCQRWKRVKYMKLLSGRILKPSHSSSFVDTLLSCQPDSPVSRLVLPEDETQQKIQDIYTHISPKESPYASQITLFSKTSKESSAAKQPMENRYSNMSSETWKKEVTVQRGEYSARLKQVRHINEKESLSWPTARNSDAEGGRIETEMSEKGFRSKRHKSDQYFGAKLRDAVETHEEKSWRTPTTEGEAGRRGLGKATCKELRAKNRTITLTRQVRDTENKNWPTPTSTERSGTNPKTGKGEGLSKKVKNWATPNTMDYMEQRSEEALRKQATTTRKGRTNPSNLREQVNPKAVEIYKEKAWPTPKSRDWKGGMGTSKERQAHDLDKIVHLPDGLPDQEKSSTSGKSQESPGKLNPNWVEQLMGLPLGWTQLPIEWID